MWRGGIRYHISFVSSRFHSCRVRLCYLPYLPDPALFTFPSVEESSNLINVTMDVTQETEYSFTVPMMAQTRWLKYSKSTSEPIITTSINENNGYLYLILLNELASSESTVTPIYFQIFASAAADHQFASQTMEHLEFIGGFSNEAFSFNVQMMTTKCQLPSMSMECLQSKDYPVLGGLEKGATYTREQTSFEITGIRQYCNMISKFTNVTATGTVPPFTMGFNISYGQDIRFDTANFSNAAYNYLLNWMTVFRYCRGGLRVSPWHDIAENVNGSSLLAMRQDVTTLAPFFSTGFYSLFNTSNVDYTAVAYFPNTARGPVDLTIPYFSRFNATLISVHGNPAVPYSKDVVSFNYSAVDADSVLSFVTIASLGAADDFIMSWQMGIPLAIRAA